MKVQSYQNLTCDFDGYFYIKNKFTSEYSAI